MSMATTDVTEPAPTSRFEQRARERARARAKAEEANKVEEAARAAVARARRDIERQAARAELELVSPTRAPLFVPPPSPDLDAALEKLASLEAKRRGFAADVERLSARAATERVRSRELAAASALGDAPEGKAEAARGEAEAAELEADRAREDLRAVESALPVQAERAERLRAEHAKAVEASAIEAERRALSRLVPALRALHAIEQELDDVTAAARQAGARSVPDLAGTLRAILPGDPGRVNSKAWVALGAARLFSCFQDVLEEIP